MVQLRPSWFRKASPNHEVNPRVKSNLRKRRHSESKNARRRLYRARQLITNETERVKTLPHHGSTNQHMDRRKSQVGGEGESVGIDAPTRQSDGRV